MSDLQLYDHPASICSQMARLALEEKAVRYRRRTVDIMQTSEQFEPWYVALNPKAVVPTLQHGETVVTDTKRIVVFVNRSFDGPDLEAGEDIPGWLDRIMDLHYGVLMYSRRIGPDGELPPQITARGTLLRRLHTERPDLREMLTRRLDGNERMQAILADGAQIEAHRSAARALVDAMAATLADRPFLAGDSYSLADCFATAACARFRIHGFDPWWRDTPLDDYITRMKARPSYAAAGVIDTGSEADL